MAVGLRRWMKHIVGVLGVHTTLFTARVFVDHLVVRVSYTDVDQRFETTSTCKMSRCRCRSVVGAKLLRQRLPSTFATSTTTHECRRVGVGSTAKLYCLAAAAAQVFTLDKMKNDKLRKNVLTLNTHSLF